MRPPGIVSPPRRRSLREDEHRAGERPPGRHDGERLAAAVAPRPCQGRRIGGDAGGGVEGRRVLVDGDVAGRLEGDEHLAAAVGARADRDRLGITRPLAADRLSVRPGEAADAGVRQRHRRAAVAEGDRRGDPVAIIGDGEQLPPAVLGDDARQPAETGVGRGQRDAAEPFQRAEAGDLRTRRVEGGDRCRPHDDRLVGRCRRSGECDGEGRRRRSQHPAQPPCALRRAPSRRRRSAFSLMKPAASFWS